nr:amidohydrolase family protein [Pumilibacter muris]
MTVDFHTHCFPDFLAPRAMENLTRISVYPPCLNGTLSALKESMDRAGIHRSVVLNIATNPKQTENVNNFAIEANADEKIIAFGSIHPDSENVVSELARLKANGILGIKFHPDFQDFEVDDRRMYPLYEKVAEFGFIMLFHCGHDLDPRAKYNCIPKAFARVAHDFRGATVVGAHLGGQDMWNEVFEYVCGKDVFVDTSYGFGWLTKEQLKRFLSEHDNDKILFGTDSPWQSQTHDVEMMKARIEDKAVFNKIMGGNAARILGI